MTLPITIIGGYLGAGKTTLVNHLLRHADGLRLAVLVNEFGELPIDQDLIEAQDDNIISIAGGCVCCSYGNDLILSLMDLAKLDPAPDHVLLEASGVALPGAIAASTTLLQGYVLDGIVVLANAETIQAQASDTYVGDTVERQLHDADLVVLNKVDLVPDTMKSQTADWIRLKAESAEIIEASYGKVPPETLLQRFLARDHTSAQKHIHQPDVFTTKSFSVAGLVDAELLAAALADASLSLIRAKGFVETPDGKKTIQVVGRRWEVTRAAKNTPPGIVVIAQKSDFDEDTIKQLIAKHVIQI